MLARLAIQPPIGPIARKRVTTVTLDRLAISVIAMLMMSGPMSMKLKYSAKRRAKLRGRSTRQTKLKLLSTFCAIESAASSRIPTLTVPSTEPLTLSTKPMTLLVISGARSPSGSRNCNSSGSRSRCTPRPLSSAKLNPRNGTIESIVV